MKITVEHSHFNRALANVQAIAGQKRSTVQVLRHVMIEAADNVCTLTTTDLDMQAKSTLPAIVTQEGKMTLPAQLLFGIISTLPEGSQIDMTLGDDGQLSLSVGKSNFKLHTLPVDDFPNFDAGTFPHQFSMEASALRYLVDKTRFAISGDHTRYYLNGIYFHVPQSSGKGNQSSLRAVATDGYRLALCDIDLPKGADKIPGVIVPRKAVLELGRWLENSESAVQVQLSKTMIRFEMDGAVLTSKLVDGSFPDYARIIPDKNDKVLSLNKKEVVRALRSVLALFRDAPQPTVPSVRLALGKNKLSLSSVLSGHGSAQEDVDAKYSGEEIEIGFNPAYLIDIVDCMDDVVKIKMASPDVAAVLENGEDDKAGKTLYVLMPMRV